MTKPINAAIREACKQCKARGWPTSPERVRLQAIFSGWSSHPYDEHRYRMLMEAMREHEIKQRLSKLLPDTQTNRPTA